MKANRIFSWLLTVILTALIITPISAAGECTEVYGKGGNSFSLATGSPGELGLLEVLAEAFDREHDAQLCWIKAGSGASLKLLHEKKVDMIMVHAPVAEKQAVEQGWAIQRTLIGSNEFYIVGPAALTHALPNPRPSFCPGGITPEPIKRKWRCGRMPVSTPREIGTLLPKIS